MWGLAFETCLIGIKPRMLLAEFGVLVLSPHTMSWKINSFKYLTRSAWFHLCRVTSCLRVAMLMCGLVIDWTNQLNPQQDLEIMSSNRSSQAVSLCRQNFSSPLSTTTLTWSASKCHYNSSQCVNGMPHQFKYKIGRGGAEKDHYLNGCG